MCEAVKCEHVSCACEDVWCMSMSEVIMYVQNFLVCSLQFCSIHKLRPGQDQLSLLKTEVGRSII